MPQAPARSATFAAMSIELYPRLWSMLSTSIGALPFAMLLLGGVAQALGPSPALVGSVAFGLTSMGAWAYTRPESQRII